MDPKEYYYGRFREQFLKFIGKTKAHKHGSEGVYISNIDLNDKSLSHVPREDYMLFHCALACTVLIDQVMYTHFSEDYRKFQAMTQYPKMEYGISSVNVNPWHITHNGIASPPLESFLAFFVDDMKEFFRRGLFVKADWNAVKSAMLKDPDVMGGWGGERLKKILCEQDSQ